MAGAFGASLNGLDQDALSSIDFGEMRDITGELLVGKMASGRVPPEGDFVVIEAPGENGSPPSALLGLLRPAMGGRFAFSLASLDEARERADLGPSFIIRQLSDRLHDVTLPPGASTVLFDKDKTVLLEAGPAPDLGPISGALLERAAREGPLEVAVEFPDPVGTILVRLEHFRPLNWYLALLVPQAEVTAPVKRMALRLAVWAILGAAAAYALSSALGRRLSDPVSALARRAEEAAKLDFSSPQASAFFSEGPEAPKAGGEIGMLSSAFDTMGLTIVSHVEALLSANKARERLDGELAAARSIQMGILPAPGSVRLPDNLSASFVLEPAKEVGGDLYDDFVSSGGKIAIVIGDVSGKGVPAALFMSMTLTLVRQLLQEGGSLTAAEIMTRVNRHLTVHNPSSMFVTLFIGLLDSQTLSLEYANGGHCQPLIAGPSGLRALEGLSGPVVGAIDGVAYQGFADTLSPGDTIILYTDGVTEAQDETGAFFGLERLEAVVKEAALEGKLNDAHNRILSAVKEFRGEAPPYDDVAILSLSCQAPAKTLLSEEQDKIKEGLKRFTEALKAAKSLS
jgi:sigma-B regulation protein RsbU (phosphoserine phosphatase)